MYSGQWLAEDVGEGGVFATDKVCGVREVVVCVLFPFPYLNLFYQVATASI
jgi:hypothetical protein